MNIAKTNEGKTKTINSHHHHSNSKGYHDHYHNPVIKYQTASKQKRETKDTQENLDKLPEKSLS